VSTRPHVPAPGPHQANLLKSPMHPWRFPQPVPTAILLGLLAFAVLATILRAVLALF